MEPIKFFKKVVDKKPGYDIFINTKILVAALDRLGNSILKRRRY